MAITMVVRKRISDYLKSHAANDLYWGDMCDYIGQKGKITDIEFLEYFVSCVTTAFNKNEKISVKQTVKYLALVEALLGWLHEDKIEIDEEILDRLRCFKEFYDDYLAKNSQKPDENINYGIDMVLAVADSLYPTSKTGESASKYLLRIDELEKQIRTLERELGESRRLYEFLQQTQEQSKGRIDLLSGEQRELEQKLRSKTRENEALSEQLSSLGQKIENLEFSLSQLEVQNTELQPYRDMCESLKKEVERLNGLLEAEQQTKKAIADFEEKQNKLECLIYQKLLTEDADINSIISYVAANGVKATKVEVANVLKHLKERINIDSSMFSTQPIYKIVPPILREDGTFSINVPLGCKHYDVMLVADFHIREFNKKVLAGFDALNDYCVRNGISLILNVGDFFHGFSSRPLDYTNAMNNYRAVEQAIEKIPQVEGLYHAILGGNHERNAANYGFDPIGLLANEREDFVSLGHIHSVVELSNVKTKLGEFDLHHPYTFDFPVRLDESGIDLREITNYLDAVYSRQGRNRNNSYIDILGHTHRSQFNYPGSYYFLPPFFEGAVKRGACHLRIYFDEDTSIKYMVFMPLNFGTKLVQNNEIVYQKMLKK